MKAYQSYHMEFHGGVPSQSVQMSRNMTITADLQFGGKGSAVAMNDDGKIEGAPSLMLGMGPTGLRIRDTKDGWFESADNGKTWFKATTDTPGGFLMGMFGVLWNARPSAVASATPYPSAGEDMVKALTFQDGDPRVEQIDGVLTRHIVARLGAATQTPDLLTQSSRGDPWRGGTREVEMWVTTDISPTIMQMVVQGGNPVAQNQLAPAQALAFSPDGHMLAVAHGHAADWTVRVWDLSRPGQPAALLKKLTSAGGPFGSVAFSPDGRWLAAGVESDGVPSSVYLWDVAALDAQPTLLAVPGSAKSVAFGNGGQLLAAGTSVGVYLWDAPFKDKSPRKLTGSAGVLVNVVQFSKVHLAAGTLNAGVLVYDLKQAQAAPTSLPHQWVQGLAFSPDGQLLASAGDFQMNNGDALKLWNLKQLQPTPVVLKKDEIGNMTVAISPDSKWLVAVDRAGRPALWELARLAQSGQVTPSVVLSVPQGETVGTVGFDPSGKVLAATAGTGVLLWQLADVGKEPGTTMPAPTLIREDAQVTDAPYMLRWKWSKFNADFGEVTAPPPDTVKNP